MKAILIYSMHDFVSSENMVNIYCPNRYVNLPLFPPIWVLFLLNNNNNNNNNNNTRLLNL
jgi:hypothetical protein